MLRSSTYTQIPVVDHIRVSIYLIFPKETRYVCWLYHRDQEIRAFLQNSLNILACIYVFVLYWIWLDDEVTRHTFCQTNALYLTHFFILLLYVQPNAFSSDMKRSLKKVHKHHLLPKSSETKFEQSFSLNGRLHSVPTEMARVSLAGAARKIDGVSERMGPVLFTRHVKRSAKSNDEVRDQQCMVSLRFDLLSTHSAFRISKMSHF